MEITDVPFAKTIGLAKSESGRLNLAYGDGILNHVNTIAAAAQFSLAELASGDYLQTLFPELIGKVLPVLRDSRLKYKKPAGSTITAHVRASDKDVAKFNRQLAKKGRALITIDVDIKDAEESVTSSGSFVWYIQESSSKR